MTAGLQVFNPDGSLQFEVTDRVFRVLTIRTFGTGNGSVSNSAISSGNTMTYVIKSNPTREQPNVTIANGLVSWNWGNVPTDQRDGDATIEVVLY